MGNETITELHLIRYCCALNEKMGTPKKAYVQDHWGALIPQAGHIGWDHVAGCGYGLIKMSEGGGESNVGCGLRCTKRELLSRLQAMIDVAHWMEDGTLTKNKILTSVVVDWVYNSRHLYNTIIATACKQDDKEAWVKAFVSGIQDYWSHHNCPATTCNTSVETGAVMLRAMFAGEIADLKGGDA